MANRIVIGAFDGTYVLRASRPGFNVLSTGLTPKQLAFDSRWPETGNELMTGTFSIGDFEQVTINYGQTFPFPPSVALRIVINASSFMTITSTVTPGGNLPIYLSGSSFTFSKGQVYAGGPPYGGVRVVHYTVFRNLYG